MHNKYTHLIATLLVLLVSQQSLSQDKTISITIDDVPNTPNYFKDGFNPKLLTLLDSLDIPFTIFINEEKVYKTNSISLNEQLLDSWIGHGQATVGNHTYSHSRYSNVGFDSFVEDIEKGENLTRRYAVKHSKQVKYFRFPFNDLGQDSVQHAKIRNHLKNRGYTIAPFTIESADWMYDYVYRYYLDNGQVMKAREIGEQYVEKTMALVRFFEFMSDSIYGRPVKHIYLCHDNALNADYLATVISKMKQENYKVISFEESLTDPIYAQEDAYFKKWGISWLYRWMETQEVRIKWMKREPDLAEIEKLYNQLYE